MYPAAIALTLALAASPAGASDATTQAPLQLRPKSAIVTAMPNHREAPFVLPPSSAPEPHLVPHVDERLEQSRSSCRSDRSLCYDAASGRIVYKPARALMPDIPGLQRENISVKRDKIVLRYTF
jgi:hypothetical protein